MVNNGRVEPASPANETPSPRLGKREGRSPRDMALSLAVLLVPIALLLVFYRVVLDGDKPAVVDPAAVFQEAGKEFPVLVPGPLGDDWHVISANLRRQDGVTLRVGYVDPDDEPIQLVQSTVAGDTLVRQEVGKDGRRTGAYRTAERTWFVYTGRPGESALVVAEPNRTLLIIGKTEQRNLEHLAAALR